MKRYRVTGRGKFRLKHWDPSDTGGFEGHKGRGRAQERTHRMLLEMESLQDRLYASRAFALLLVLQGMDTAGKDGTIKHVLSGVNPAGCRVHSFKVPTPEEAAHDFLWRIHRRVPERGFIGIFNRSHYEDVLVTRVHGLISDEEAGRRLAQIRDFESMLTDNGVRLVKVFLNVSKAEQRRRLRDRVQVPEKRWKLSPADIKERALWKDYQKAYQEAIAATATRRAPWHVVPADHHWYRDYVVSRILVGELESMGLEYPAPDKELDFAKIVIP